MIFIRLFTKENFNKLKTKLQKKEILAIFLTIIAFVVLISFMFSASIKAEAAMRHENTALKRTVEELEDVIISQNGEIVMLENLAELNMNERFQYLGEFTLTFYSKEQFPNSKTASGVYPVTGVTVAVDKRVIPLGTPLYIEGFGTRFAQDTGGAIKGNKIDVFVDTTKEAYQLGVQRNISVWKIA